MLDERDRDAGRGGFGSRWLMAPMMTKGIAVTVAVYGFRSSVLVTCADGGLGVRCRAQEGLVRQEQKFLEGR